jgi:hypothetical protein
MGGSLQPKPICGPRIRRAIRPRPLSDRRKRAYGAGLASIGGVIELSRRKACSRTAGFSLTEALVALAIAALLVTVLTRFVSGTRANAMKIHDEIALELASDSLLENFVAPATVPARMDGRNGSFGWHVDVAPIAFLASPEVVSKAKPGAEGDNQAKGQGLGLSASSSAPSFGSSSQENQTTAKAAPRIIWTPYHVTAVVNASSGRSYAIDTIRIVRQQPERQFTEPERR